MRILTVDDSSVVRKIIRSSADVLDFELIEAENGYEAFERLDEYEGNVDLILLDWNMPGMDGYEVLTKLKSGGSYVGIPVMMVTTETQKESIVTAIRAGAVNYLTKPFTVEDLTVKIMECFGREGA